jgi:hypothetical protein
MTDITQLAYEKITDKYYKARYLGLECIMDITNGYINGTKCCLCAKDKSKKIVNYIDRMRSKILINYYMSNITEYSADLSINVVDGIKEIRGTYLHPILFLDLAIWISPAAYMKANKIITDTLLKEIDKGSDKEIDKEKFVDEKLSILEKSLEEAIKKKEEMEKIITQNEKTYKALENIEKDTYKIKMSLRRVESQFETKPLEQKTSFWKKCLSLKN